MIKNLIKLFILSFIFTIVVFYIKTTIFTNDNVLIEEKYIEPEVKKLDINKNFFKKLEEKQDFSSAKKYYFVYIPWEIKNKLKNYQSNIKVYIDNKNIFNTIFDLRVNFYWESKDRRWKMKNKTIKIYNPIKIWEAETQNIFIHEFAHYLDLYFFDLKNWKDISYKFYQISWDDTKIIKAGQNNKDFVSGYAMTNKYEDFAESFTYFVIANKDFLQKTKFSKVLKQKYNFFSSYLFKNWFLKDTKFTKNLIIRDYYRDITKLKLDLKNFLQYFKN